MADGAFGPSARRWLGVRERMLDPGRRSLTTGEAAAMIGVSIPTIRLWADSGRVPCHRTAGGHRRFEVEEIRDWLRSTGAPPPRAVRAAPSRVDFLPCPRMAGVLVDLIGAVAVRATRHETGGPDRPVPMPSSNRSLEDASRYVRPLARTLELGRLGQMEDRAEAAGLRGTVRGQEVEVLIQDRRLSAATIAEAEDAIAGGADVEEFGLATLHSVAEHLTAALVRGLAGLQSEIPEMPAAPLE